MVKTKWTLDTISDELRLAGYTLVPETYVSILKDKLHTKCPSGHSYHVRWYNFYYSKNRCPICSGRARPEWAKIEESFKKLGYILTSGPDAYINNSSKLSFVCDSGHENSISWDSIRSGHGCSLCKGHVALPNVEDIRKAFEKEGYTLLTQEVSSSKSYLNFLCPNGHRHRIDWNKFQQGRRCGKCAVNHRWSETRINNLLSEYGYELISISPSSRVSGPRRITLRCPRGHKRTMTLSSFISGKRCKRCLAYDTRSGPEEEIFNILREKEPSINIITNTTDVIPPKELDLYLPDHSLAIEHCGLLWHSESFGGKSRTYHREKFDACRERGIRLITIFGDEFLTKKDIVMSRIFSALGWSKERIFARHTGFYSLTVPQAKLFLEENHLQGYSPCKYRFGLYYNGGLVQVMTFGLPSRANARRDGLLEMKRLASRPYVSVVGGASKLFTNAIKYIKLEYKELTTVKSYCDLRWANTDHTVYDMLGFSIKSETKWTPHYLRKYKTRVRNQSLAKSKLEKTCSSSEWELRKSQGFDRIWDCGHRTYEKDVSGFGVVTR